MNGEQLFTAFGEIDDRFIEEAKEAEKLKHRNSYRWIIAAACFAVVVCLGVYRQLSLSKDTISVNIIKNEYSMGSPKFYDPDYHSKEAWNQKQVAEYFTKDYTEIDMPLNLKSTSIRAEFIINNNENSVARDITRIKYENEKGQLLYISLSRIESPNQVFYEFEKTGTEVSKINGVDVIIAGKVSEKDVERFEKIIGSLNSSGNIIRVEGRGLNIEDFHDILKKIMK